MTASSIVRARLRSQRLTAPAATPTEVVRRLGALQAQDYAWGIWSVAARVDPVSALATQPAVEQALAEASIVRSWPMRRTLHLVAAADLRWMLATMAVRAVVQAAPRRRDLGITDAQVAQARDIWAAALEGGRRLTRTAMLDVLEQGGIPTDGQRGYHLLVHHAQEGLLCLGPNEGKEQTFVLLDEWIAPAPPLPRDEALATLALRYFTGHGPATVHDLGWWSGMPLGELRAGLSAVSSSLEARSMDNREYWMAPGALDQPALESEAPPLIHLLSGYDEMLLGYRDREATLAAEFAERICPGGNGVFRPVILRDGVVEGGWQRTVKKKSVDLTIEPFTAPDRLLAPPARPALDAAVSHYGAFLGLPARLQTSTRFQAQ